VLQALLLAGIALGSVLQQAAGALHLARHDHRIEAQRAEHVHTHGPAHHHEVGFGHHEAPQRFDEDAGGHVPHPVEDHLERGVEQAVPPLPDAPVLATAPARAALQAPEVPVAQPPDVDRAGPRGPPPRGAPSSRAPPIAC
jgi:hypothetical protein